MSSAELQATLAATLDASSDTRRAAEARLKSLEAQPGALGALLQLAVQGGGACDEATRRAAAIRFKNLLHLRPPSEVEQLAFALLQAVISTPHCSTLGEALRLLAQLHFGFALGLASALRLRIETAVAPAPSAAVRALEKVLRGATARDDSPGAASALVAVWSLPALLSSASALLPAALAGDATQSTALRLHFKCAHRLWCALGSFGSDEAVVNLAQWMELGGQALVAMSTSVAAVPVGKEAPDEEGLLRARWGVQRRVMKWVCSLLEAPGGLPQVGHLLLHPVMRPIMLVAALPPRLVGERATSLALEALRRIAREGFVPAAVGCVHLLQRVVLPQLELRPADWALWRDDEDEYVRRFLDIDELELEDADGDVPDRDASSAGQGEVGAAPPHKAAAALLQMLLEAATDVPPNGQPQQEKTSSSDRKKKGKSKTRPALCSAEEAVLEVLDALVAQHLAVHDPPRLHATLLALAAAAKTVEKRGGDAAVTFLSRLVLPVVADAAKHAPPVRAAGCMALAAYARLVPAALLPEAIRCLLACATADAPPTLYPEPGAPEDADSVRPLRLAGAATLLSLLRHNEAVDAVLPPLLPAMLEGAVAAAATDGLAVGCALLSGMVSCAGEALLPHAAALLGMLHASFVAGSRTAAEAEKCAGVLAAVAEALSDARDSTDAGANVAGSVAIAQLALRDGSRALLRATSALLAPLRWDGAALLAARGGEAAAVEAHRAGLGASIVELSAVVEYLYEPTAGEEEEEEEGLVGALPRALRVADMDDVRVATPAEATERLQPGGAAWPAAGAVAEEMAGVLHAFAPMLAEAACDEAWEASDGAVRVMLRHLGSAPGHLFRPVPPLAYQPSSGQLISALAPDAAPPPSAAQSLAAVCCEALASGGPGAARRAGLHLLHLLSHVPHDRGAATLPTHDATQLQLAQIAQAAAAAIERGAAWPRSTAVAVLLLCRCVCLGGILPLSALVHAGGPRAPLGWLRALLTLLEHALHTRVAKQLFPPRATPLLLDGCAAALRLGLQSQIDGAGVGAGVVAGAEALGELTTDSAEGRYVPWPIHDILSLVCVCARINHPFIIPAHSHYPHCCNTIARLLRNVWHGPPFICHTPYNIASDNIV